MIQPFVQQCGLAGRSTVVVIIRWLSSSRLGQSIHTKLTAERPSMSAMVLDLSIEWVWVDQFRLWVSHAIGK